MRLTSAGPYSIQHAGFGHSMKDVGVLTGCIALIKGISSRLREFEKRVFRKSGAIRSTHREGGDQEGLSCGFKG